MFQKKKKNKISFLRKMTKSGNILNIKNIRKSNVIKNMLNFNDNTELVGCAYKDLEGQFYHYDEQNFMDIMFIEQFESNLKRVAKAEKIRALGFLSYALKLFFNGYNISNKEVNKLNNQKLQDLEIDE